MCGECKRNFLAQDEALRADLLRWFFRFPDVRAVPCVSSTVFDLVSETP